MDNGTIFYVIGPLLAVSAVVVAFIGLRFEKFPGRFGPLVALWFIVLVGAATTLRGAALQGRGSEEGAGARPAARRPKNPKAQSSE